MPDIYLARHGEDKDNAEGIINGRRDRELTPKGRGQAEDLAERIESSGITIDKAFSSPQKRAYETGTIIAQRLGLASPQELELLKERDLGEMEGGTIEDVKELPDEDLIYTEEITYILSPKGGELFPEVLERAKEVLRVIREECPEGDILVTAHSDIGKMMYTAYYDLDWRAVLKGFYFDNSDLLLLSEDSDPEEPFFFEQ